MSSIEERLARDIAAITGGVIVTDSDLHEARTDMHERIEIDRRRNRLRSGAVAAAAAVVLVAAGVTTFLLVDDDTGTARPVGPAPAVDNLDEDFLKGSPPSSRLLQGIWRLDNGQVLVRFGSDGTVQFDEHGTLFTHPVTTGTYTVVGDVITVTAAGDEQSGCIGNQFAMRASLTGPGSMHVVPSDRTGGACAPVPSGRWTFEQVLPTTNQDLADLVFSKDDGWQPVDKSILYGVWLAEGGGYVLEIDHGGSYYVADDSGQPVDEGRWSLRGTELTLTSSARSAECNQGDKLVLGAVEQENPGTPAVRGQVKKNTCGGGWTPAAWILFPNMGRR